jgi:hypothetical protein
VGTFLICGGVGGARNLGKDGSVAGEDGVGSVGDVDSKRDGVGVPEGVPPTTGMRRGGGR